MDPNPSSAAAPAALAPLHGGHALRLTALPPVSQPSFDLTHPYVELVYAHSLGPTAVLLARYFGRMLTLHPSPIAICPIALALELGLRSSSEDPLGHRSSLRKALDRLVHQRVARWVDDNHLAVYVAVPAVSDRVRERLPPAARHAHDNLVGVIDLRDGRVGRDRSMG